MPASITLTGRIRHVAAALSLCAVAAVTLGLPAIAFAQGRVVSVLATHDETGRRGYLDDQNPIADPVLSPEGVLTFRNLAVDRGWDAPPAAYRAAWFALDNIHGSIAGIGETEGADSMLDAPRTLVRIDGYALRVDIGSVDGPAAWTVLAQAYFVCDHDQWRLVGFERPDGGRFDSPRDPER